MANRKWETLTEQEKIKPKTLRIVKFKRANKNENSPDYST